MMQYKINAALQIIPAVPGDRLHAVVDAAIAVIRQSGIHYRVCPFETVMEGYYDEIMDVVKKAQQVCFEQGAGQVLSFVKLQIRAQADVTMEEKMVSYDPLLP